MSIRMITETVDTNKKTVRKILHDELNKKKVCKVGPKKFDPWPKAHLSTDVLRFSLKVRRRAWIDGKHHHMRRNLEYDVETKWQSTHLKTPASLRMKKARMLWSKFTAMLIVFSDINSIVMTEWVPEGQIVNQTYYLKVLTILWEQVVRNSRNCGKTSNGSCTRTTHLPILRCL